MNKLFALMILPLVLGGCANNPLLHIERVEVPIPVPCNIVGPKKPSMPFSDSAYSGDIFAEGKAMLAEIENRKGYETELEAAIKACNSK